VKQSLQWLRQQLHPLWRLRQRSAYRWLIRHADWPVPRRMGQVVAHAYFWRDWGRVHPAAQGEVRTSAAFCALLPRWECDCLLDIGAHVGGYTWLAANLCPQARLLLFEPDPRNQAVLRRTMARSRLPDATLHPCALADATGRAQFTFDLASGATGSLLAADAPSAVLREHYRDADVQLVETRTMDSFLPELRGRRVVLKIDVEGAEDRVFAGATRVLSEIRPAVLYESFSPDGGAALLAADYVICSLQENSNYLALPRERAALAEELGLTVERPTPRR
jgi:FkbM family methyltransferase